MKRTNFKISRRRSIISKRSNYAAGKTRRRSVSLIRKVYVITAFMKKSWSREQRKWYRKSWCKAVWLVRFCGEKVKDVDLDLNFGQSVDVEHIFQFKDASLSHLDIQLANGSLNVMPWDDRDIRAECHAKIYRAEDGEQARQQFLNQLDCGLEGDKFLFEPKRRR